MPSNKYKFISKPRLYQRKVKGCHREFGFIETILRIVRELLRMLKKSDGQLDLSYITENLAIGSAPRSFNNIRCLIELGFKHVIDLRGERKNTDILVKAKEISVKWVPIYDDWKPKPPEIFQKLMTEINTILQSKNSGKLFLCCGAGEHRAPLAGVVALLAIGHSLNSSIVIIQKARPVAELLPVYKSSLNDFIKEYENYF